MDFSPDSSTNTDTDREEDKSVEAMKTRLGPLPLLCPVTVLNLINGFFFFSCHRKAGKINTCSGKEMSVWYGYSPTQSVQTGGWEEQLNLMGVSSENSQYRQHQRCKAKHLTLIKLYAIRRTPSWRGWIGKKLLEHYTDLLSIIKPIRSQVCLTVPSASKVTLGCWLFLSNMWLLSCRRSGMWMS